jgi:hypothetical protein
VRGGEGGGLLVHFMAFSGHLTGCRVIDVVWARGDVAWSPPGLASTGLRNGEGKDVSGRGRGCRGCPQHVGFMCTSIREKREGGAVSMR